MGDTGDRRDDEKAILRALFCYGVIAPLVERETFAPGELSAKVAEIVAQLHYYPGKGPWDVTERTIWNWLKAYRQGGIEQLSPKLRQDRGRSRVLAEDILQRAMTLRQENPKRWTSTVMDILRRESGNNGSPLPHRSTLDRHLRARGMSRRQLRTLGARVHIKMRFEHFGDLWVSDYHHGPLVRDPSGKPTTAKLAAVIDHTTRYPVADRYYLNENIGSLRDCMMRALMRFGGAKLIYADQGAVYRAEQLRYSLDRLQIKLVHSAAYYSEGRGVIERWWQLILQFEEEVRLRQELLTLHELNLLWESFKELRYCQVVHSELGRTPNEAIAEVTPQPIDPQVLRELFLIRLDRTVHKKDCCVPVLGQRYLCDSTLRGQRVQVRLDANDPSSVLIFRHRQRLQRAFPQPVGGTPEPHRPEVERPLPSVDYLALVREDFDRQLLEHAKPLAYAQLVAEPSFDAEAFLQTVTALAGLPLHPLTRRELQKFFETYGPFPEELCRIGTEHAIRLHGRNRHPRVYLNAIRTLVLAHWRVPK
jgi:transposase InsO family protein